MRLIIDGDIVAFTAALRNPEDVKEACKEADNIVEGIYEGTWCTLEDVEMYIKGDGNFRMGHTDYKAVRKGTVDKRPATLGPVREYLTGKEYCEAAHGAEADDFCTTAAQEALSEGTPYIIATIDKDLRQMSGNHYNIRSGILDFVSDEDGYTFLLQQSLTGDAVDGIQGLKGIGPKRAQAILASDPNDREGAIARKYCEVYGAAPHPFDESLPAWKYELEKCWNLVYMRRSREDNRLLPLPPEFTL